MNIIKSVKQLEIIILRVPRIEDDNLILISLIIRLVISQENICSQIRIHLAHSIEENIRTLIAVILLNMIHDQTMHVKPETLIICLTP